MTVSTAKKTATVLVLGFALLAGRARADSFTFASSIYGDGKEKETPLFNPEGVACSPNAVAIADTGNHRLLLFPLKDGRLGASTQVKLAQLTAPVRLQIDSKGNLLALDSKTQRIVKVDQQGGFAGFAGVAEAKSVPSATAAMVDGFKLDAADNLYVLDGAGRKVLVHDAAGALTRQVDLPKGNGMFVDVAVDAGGTIYVAEAVEGIVWSVDKTGTAFKPLTPSLKDRMSFPTYLTVNRGKLYLVDTNGNGVVVLGLDGAFLGRQLSLGWSEGQVNYPSQLCVNEGGEVFVADRFNHRVQEFLVR